MLNHLTIAQEYWRKVIRPGDKLFDATCGNGHDTLQMAKLLFAQDDFSGKIWAMDIQETALLKTYKRLQDTLSAASLDSIYLKQGCHSSPPKEIEEASLRLAVYNLGYLPGANKHLTTAVATTLQSLVAVCDLLAPEGLLSIMCYPGHDEGAREQEALRCWIATLSQEHWSGCWHHFPMGHKAPSLLLLHKKPRL